MKTLRSAIFAISALLAFAIFTAELPIRDTLAPTNAVVVSKSDTVNLPQTCTKLYVGGAGNVAMVMKSGDVVTLTAVPVGTTISASFNRINSTNTTATLMVAFY